MKTLEEMFGVMPTDRGPRSRARRELDEGVTPDKTVRPDFRPYQEGDYAALSDAIMGSLTCPIDGTTVKKARQMVCPKCGLDLVGPDAKLVRAAKDVHKPPDDTALAALFGISDTTVTATKDAMLGKTLDVYVCQSRLVGLHYKCAQVYAKHISHPSLRSDFWEDEAVVMQLDEFDTYRLGLCELCEMRALSDKDLMALMRSIVNGKNRKGTQKYLRNGTLEAAQFEVLDFIRKERVNVAREASERRRKDEHIARMYSAGPNVLEWLRTRKDY